MKHYYEILTADKIYYPHWLIFYSLIRRMVVR